MGTGNQQQTGGQSIHQRAGGRAIFVASEWEQREIELRFLDVSTFVYDTAPYDFIGNLSILDVLMWNSPGDVTTYIQEQTRIAC